MFAEDLQHSPDCSGPLRWIEVATTSDAIPNNLLERHADAAVDAAIDAALGT